MKKDFSQPFEVSKSVLVCLIVEDNPSRRILLLESTEPHEEGFYRTLRFDLDAKEQFAQQLARFLYQHGLALVSFREMARLNEVAFSFSDDTHGASGESICVHVRADRTDFFDASWENERPSFQSCGEALDKLKQSPFMEPVFEIGLARLLLEREVLDPSSE